MVVVYNYSDDVVLECVIDPLCRNVIEVNERRDQPPLTGAEQSQALEIVRRDGRLPEAGIDLATGVGLIVEEANTRSPHHGHRLVDLRFGPEDRYLPTAFAIVDLSALEVARIGLLPEEASS
jgi:hypothetical protein